MQYIDYDKIFVSSTVEDLVETRNTAEKAIRKLGFIPVLSEKVKFKYGPAKVDSHDHCIDEALKCQNLIYIVGNEYGGKYAGSKYKKYADEIKHKSKGKIEEPSISLMEYYVARCNNVDCKVFVLKNVLDEKTAKKKNQQLQNQKCDVRVFNIVNFITHITVNGKREGNWFNTFSNDTHLKNIINNMEIKSLLVDHRIKR